MASPATLARKFKIEYGEGSDKVTIGEGTTRIDAEGGKLNINQTVESFSIEFHFVLIGSSAANLESETNDLEKKLKYIRQPVKITINDEVAWDFKHEDNTGYNSRVTLRKTGTAKDGGLARTFHCKIDLGLPFNDPGPDDDLKGRRSSQISIAYSTNRRISLNISGEYACDTTAAADGPHNAIQNYYRAINAYVSTVKTSMFGSVESHDGVKSGLNLVFERTSEDYSYDDQELILNFSIGEQEILYPQAIRDGADPFDDPTIFNQSLNISQSRTWPGDTPTADPLARYRLTRRTASYSCLVKKDVADAANHPSSPTSHDWSDRSIVDVTDILEAKYNDIIRPFMIHELNNLKEFQGDDQPLICTIVEETSSYDKTGMAISASMTVDIIVPYADQDNFVLQKSVTMTDDESMGAYFVPVWATGNQGGRLSKYLFNGPGSHVRRITAVYRTLNTQAKHLMGIKGKDGRQFLGAQAAGIEGGLDGITPTGNGWVLMDQHTEATVIEVGTPVGQGDDTEPYIVTDYTLSTVSERFEAVEGSETVEAPVSDPMSPVTAAGLQRGDQDRRRWEWADFREALR